MASRALGLRLGSQAFSYLSCSRWWGTLAVEPVQGSGTMQGLWSLAMPVPALHPLTLSALPGPSLSSTRGGGGGVGW